MILHDYSIDSEDEYEQVRELLAERDRLREALEKIGCLTDGDCAEMSLDPPCEVCEALCRPENERG
jgi:hypothetical protein